MKKIAIFHNFMDNIGGAEIVALTLARNLDADIYTTNIDHEKIKKMGFEDVLPRFKSIGEIPKQAPFRQQLALWKFRKLNLGSKYDFYIIAGDWAMSGAVNNKPNLWYVHSPLNELWQFTDSIKKNMLIWWKRPIFDIWVYINRKLTLKYSKNVQKWACNSKNTQNRILKFYKKEAHIIYPPIDTHKYYYAEPKNYWLSVSRFVIHKRLEIQMEAFRRLPEENLILVASYEKGVSQFEHYKNKIESMKPDNVKILHWTDQNELLKLYAECKGYISTTNDEDFGMTVVEAMASGKPVIASNSGGYKETVISGETGILIDDINPTKVVQAVKDIRENLSSYKENCIKQAQKFDTIEFIEKIKSLICL